MSSMQQNNQSAFTISESDDLKPKDRIRDPMQQSLPATAFTSLNEENYEEVNDISHLTGFKTTVLTIELPQPPADLSSLPSKKVLDHLYDDIVTKVNT